MRCVVVLFASHCVALAPHPVLTLVPYFVPPPPHLPLDLLCWYPQLDLPVPSMHRDALRLLSNSVDRLASVGDKEGIAVLWHSMLYSFLQVEADAQVFKPQAVAEASGSPQPRDIVSTPYGIGVVEAVRAPGAGQSGLVYEVMLPWCRAVLQADALKPAPSTPGKPVGDLSTVAGSSVAADLPPHTLYCSSAGHLFFRLYHILTVCCGFCCSLHWVSCSPVCCLLCRWSWLRCDCMLLLQSWYFDVPVHRPQL
jgi:hypothetical protein